MFVASITNTNVRQPAAGKARPCQPLLLGYSDSVVVLAPRSTHLHSRLTSDKLTKQLHPHHISPDRKP